MATRYIIYIFITFLINFFCWFYIITFCGIYVTTVTGWVNGSLVSLFLDWVIISVIIPFLKTIIRITVRKYSMLKFLIGFEYTFWILNLKA